MMEEETDCYYLELSENPIRFEAGNQLTNVFFDDSNKHVFAIRSGGVMGVVVKGIEASQESLNFRMEDRGPVLSIKFSLDQKVLAVHRTNYSVEFMNFDGNSVDSEYSQACKRNSKILGFVWISNNEVAFFTDHGVELYRVIVDKKSLKLLVRVDVPIQWFVWCPTNQFAVLASSHGSHLQPVFIKQGSISKLSKVDTEAGKMALERDVTLASLYGTPSILILRHQTGPQTAEVHIHMLNGPGQAPVKSHVLKLGLSGRFAINVLDDLIFIHNQASRSSQVFDIALPGETDGSVKYHTTVAPAKSIKPASLLLPGISKPETYICELYSPNWVVFQPNIIIDAKLGCLWLINLRLSELCSLISDLVLRTRMTLNRSNGKSILLKFLFDSIKMPSLKLDKIQESFYYINKLNAYSAEHEHGASSPGVTSGESALKMENKITQEDMVESIFKKLDIETEAKLLEWILIAYLHSLSEYNICVQENINEMLLTTLVRRKKFFNLQQLLQYGVIADSKPLACFLLSLGNVYDSAFQLALDMLSRLGAKDEIREILLHKGKTVAALKYFQDPASARKFLQAAKDSGDSVLYHTVVFYVKNNFDFFDKDEHAQEFIEHFNNLFFKENEITNNVN